MGTNSNVAICNCRNAPNCRHYMQRVTTSTTEQQGPVIPPPHAPSVIRHHSQHPHHPSTHPSSTDVAGIEEVDDYHSQYQDASLTGAGQQQHHHHHQNGHGTLRSVAVSHSSCSTNSVSPSPSQLAAAASHRRGHRIRDPVTNDDVKYPKSEYCSPSSCICLLIALILISIGATSGIFFGLKSYDGRSLRERVFKVQFIVTRGEPYDPRFENPNSDLFKETSVKYEEKLNKLFNTSRLAKSFKKSEVIALEKAKDGSDDVVIHSNLHFIPRLRSGSSGDFSSADVYILLSTEFLKTRHGLFSSVTVDQASLDVTERKQEGFASRFSIPFYPTSDSLSATGRPEDLTRSTGSGGDSSSYFRGSNNYYRNPWEPKARFPGVLEGLTTEASPPVRRCQKIDISFCASVLPYNWTSYPNIVGHWNATSVEESFIAFRQIVDAECYPLAREFICRILQPECQSDELVYPCRDFCNDFKRSCGSWLERDDKKKSLFEKMIKCADFPRYDGDDGSDEVATGSEKSQSSLNSVGGASNRPHFHGTSVVYYDEEFNGRYTTQRVNEKRKCRSKPGCSNELKLRGRPHHVCDAVIDCPDSSDETSCDYCSSGLTSSSSSSSSTSSSSPSSSSSSSSSGNSYWKGGAGGGGGGGGPSESRKNVFYCGNKQCIEWKRLCDSVIDCNNGADEENCIRLEPSVLLDPEFVYQKSGVLVSRIRGKNAKVCGEKVENVTIPLLRNSYTLERAGSNLCTALGYKQLLRVEPKVDNDRRSLFTQLEEINVDFSGGGGGYLRQSETACNSRQVIVLSCDGLVCGKNPLFAPPDKRTDEVLPSTLKRIYEQFEKNIDILPGSVYSANDGDWPWAGSLFKDGQFFCDASLIDEQWVLTSSACFDELSIDVTTPSNSQFGGGGQSVSSHWKISLGSVRLTSKSPLFAQEKEVVALVHSPPDRNSDKRLSGLSLLKLDTPVNASNYVRPVCIHSNSISSTEFRKLSSSDCFSTNWDIKKDRLEFIRSSIVDIKDCENLIEPTDGPGPSDARWRDINICVRVPHTKDGQIAVPGRALYCSTSPKQFSIIGLEASISSNILRRNRIADQISSSSSSVHLFTRVSHHSGWIYQILDSFKRSASSIDEVRVTAPPSFVDSGPVYSISPSNSNQASSEVKNEPAKERPEMNWQPEISALN